MKKSILYLFLVLSTISLKAQDFYDIEYIRNIDIVFSQANWDDILDTYKATSSELRLIGTATIDGVLYDSVGVRYKGNSSYDTTNVKNPFNIKLDYIKGKAEIDGRNVLKLSNIFKDPSYVREVLSYEIARKYMPASTSNFAKVTVNGTYIGLYVNDESTNLAFAGKHYFKSNWPFFEGDFSPGPPPTGCPGGAPTVFGYLGTDSTCYQQYYGIQSNNPLDWFELSAALDTFNNQPANIDNAFYIDRILWMLAFDNVLANLDAPIGPPHNFLIYKDRYTKRFNPMVWDLNQSFGAFNVMGSLSNTQIKELSPWYNTTDPNYPVLTKTLATDRNKKMYIAKMKTIFDENIDNDLYKTRAIELQTLISSEVSNDVNGFYSVADFNSSINSSVSGILGLAELMDARKIFLNGQADFQKIAPEISNITSDSSEVHSNTSVTISAEITGANYAHLGYRFGPKSKFVTIPMTNSGTTYSATINVQTADVEYYIWAENDDAGLYSPARAEYEFYRIGVTGDLVINEIQASNESTQFDESVEYDDWIELYNNSDADISIGGYYISDNKDTLMKWQIPTQTISANGYAMFWADKDEAQGLNHTNFQLTRNGESLYLVNPSGDVIDQVTYPHQVRDLSYSRYINGRGGFISKEPTFEASNGGDTISSIHVVDNELLELNIFPNPNNKYLNLQIDSDRKTSKKVQILNTVGKEMMHEDWTINKTKTIDISKLSKGVYFIQVDGFKMKKFIKK